MFINKQYRNTVYKSTIHPHITKHPQTNTHTHTHTHITKPTHTHPYVPTRTHPHITKPIKTTTVQDTRQMKKSQ